MTKRKKKNGMKTQTPHQEVFGEGIRQETLYSELGGKPLGYRCEYDSFASCVIISNPDSLSSSETRVNPGIIS
jgi:hypothetical protein